MLMEGTVQIRLGVLTTGEAGEDSNARYGEWISEQQVRSRLMEMLTLKGNIGSSDKEIVSGSHGEDHGEYLGAKTVGMEKFLAKQLGGIDGKAGGAVNVSYDRTRS